MSKTLPFKSLVFTGAATLRELADSTSRDSMEIRAHFNDLRASISDHGGLTGLADDDHPQYGALAQDEIVTGTWTFNNYINFDTSGNQIQAHSDSSGKFVLERNGVAGTFEIGNTIVDLDTTIYGDLSVSKSLTVGDDITGTGGTIINGGTGSGNALALEATTHGTKGGISISSVTSGKVYTNGASAGNAAFNFGGSIAVPVTALSSNTTLSNDNFYVIVDTSGGNVTISLPITNTAGRVYIIKKKGVTNTLTVSHTGGADRIVLLGVDYTSGVTTTTVANASDLRLVSDGTNWLEF